MRAVSHISTQGNDGGAPTPRFGGRVAEGFDENGAGQDRAYHFALHADATAMDNAEGFVTQTVSFPEVFFNNFLDVARRHAVEIEDVGDGQATGSSIIAGQKAKGPVSRSRPGPKPKSRLRAPESCDLRPALAQHRFHLIL